MIESMLSQTNVRIVDSVTDWKDAIYIAVQPLVETGFVEERYIQGIIDNTFLYGPYYVLAPDVALPHARPEQGVIKKQLGVTVLRQPVKFSEDGYDVRLLITLAAVDNISHLEALKYLADIISDENRVQRILSAKTIEDIYHLFLEKKEKE